ncbi:hypothetical protein EDB89DRAFT_1906538 [Lactarius sanguifluus]|nr:hypothetical protein EDB89DRAFT_1906538 [Lactarius sanguifluus]
MRAGGPFEAQGVGVAVATLEPQCGFVLRWCRSWRICSLDDLRVVLAGLVHSGPRWAVVGACRGVVEICGHWRGLCMMDRGGDHGAGLEHDKPAWMSVLVSVLVSVSGPVRRMTKVTILRRFKVKREQKKEKRKKLNEAVRVVLAGPMRGGSGWWWGAVLESREIGVAITAPDFSVVSRRGRRFWCRCRIPCGG